jgi:type VI secretion system secreted protein Hcp
MKKWMLVVMASALLSFVQIDRSHATDMFLFIQGVPGEAAQAPHANWIHVESAAWGHAGKTPFEPLGVTKVVDISSPMLALAAADGRHFQTAILDVTKPGAQPVIFLKVILTDVTVKSYAAAASNGSNAPAETVKLGFAKIEWIYYQQMPNGTLSPTPARTGWDVINNKPF